MTAGSSVAFATLTLTTGGIGVKLCLKGYPSVITFLMDLYYHTEGLSDGLFLLSTEIRWESAQKSFPLDSPKLLNERWLLLREA